MLLSARAQKRKKGSYSRTLVQAGGAELGGGGRWRGRQDVERLMLMSHAYGEG
jgi:hypothetical protein